MKKTLLVLPLAVLLVNCSTSRNTGNETNSSTSGNTSMMTDGSLSSTNVPAAADQAQYNATAGTEVTANADINTNHTSTSLANRTDVATTSDAYHVEHPINRGNVYNGYNDARAADLALSGTGGWTYNTDTRRNINFDPQVNGEWTLTMTPEVATAWRQDRNTPDMYASFWAPENYYNRQTYLSASATMDTRTDAERNQLNSDMDAGVTADANAGIDATADVTANVNINTNHTSTNLDVQNQANTNNNQHVDANISSEGSTAWNDQSLNNTGSTDISSINYTATNGNNFHMPRLNLHLENGSFTGYTGCNQIMGSMVVDGNNIRFDNTTPATAIECTGGFDQAAFIDRMRRVNNYEMAGNELRLKDGNEVLMVLARNN